MVFLFAMCLDVYGRRTRSIPFTEDFDEVE